MYGTHEMVSACAFFSLLFFVLGLMLGKNWKRVGGGGAFRRPDFKRPATSGGRSAAQAVEPRRDGPVEIYAGNLPLETTREDVEREFGKYGKVLNIRLITKPNDTKSFGFIEMAVPAEADKAIEALAGKEFRGNLLEVNVAKSPRGHHRRRRR